MMEYFQLKKKMATQVDHERKGKNNEILFLAILRTRLINTEDFERTSYTV